VLEIYGKSGNGIDAISRKQITGKFTSRGGVGGGVGFWCGGGVVEGGLKKLFLQEKTRGTNKWGGPPDGEGSGIL